MFSLKRIVQEFFSCDQPSEQLISMWMIFVIILHAFSQFQMIITPWIASNMQFCTCFKNRTTAFRLVSPVQITRHNSNTECDCLKIFLSLLPMSCRNTTYLLPVHQGALQSRIFEPLCSRFCFYAVSQQCSLVTTAIIPQEVGRSLANRREPKTCNILHQRTLHFHPRGEPTVLVQFDNTSDI